MGKLVHTHPGKVQGSRFNGSAVGNEKGDGKKALGYGL
jgi:hypothetical protein